MSRFKKYNKAIVGSVMTFVLLTGIYVAKAADFAIPQHFNPGDLISADTMNDVFEYIAQTQKDTSMSELIGSWSCMKYFAGDVYPSVSAYYQSPDPDHLWHTLQMTLTFSDNGNGTYSWSSPTYNAFVIGSITLDKCDGAGKAAILNNKIAVTGMTCPAPGNPSQQFTRVLEMKRVSTSRIELKVMGTDAVFDVPPLQCDKQNLPSAIPTNLAASASGLSINLTWTDNSSDETGFKVLRKDSLTGPYNLITTTAANATSYTDTAPSAGASYWYRVESTNANGDSLGSNEVLVTLP